MPELSPLSRRIQALSNGHNLEFVAAELNLTEQQVYDRLLNPLLPDPPSGGSGGLKEIVFPFTFETPGLEDGVEIYVPTVGDRILGESMVSFSTTFDGTTPQWFVGTAAMLTDADKALFGDTSATLDGEATGDSKLRRGRTLFSHPWWGAGGDGVYVAEAAPLLFLLFGSAIGDPVGGAAGAGEVRLLVVPKGAGV